MVSMALLSMVIQQLGKTGKQSEALSATFGAMKEATHVTTLYSTILEMLNQAVTIESMDSIKKLVELVTDPELKPIIDAMAFAIGILVDTLSDAWDKAQPLLQLLGLFSADIKTLEDDLDDLVEDVVDPDVLREWLLSLPELWEGLMDEFA